MGGKPCEPMGTAVVGRSVTSGAQLTLFIALALGLAATALRPAHHGGGAVRRLRHPEVITIMSISTLSTSRGLAVTGILSGLGILGEFTFFTLSGFPAAGFSDPTIALPYLERGGSLLRVAVLFGAANIALWTAFSVALAARLGERTPALAAATLLLTVIGNSGDGLVALSFYRAVSTFTDVAVRDQAAAASAWTAFAAVTAGYQAFANFFLGLSLLSAGWAIVSVGALSRGLGVLAALAGAVTLASVLGLDAAYLLALILVLVFRVWSGVAVLRSTPQRSVSTSGGAPTSSAASPANF